MRERRGGDGRERERQTSELVSPGLTLERMSRRKKRGSHLILEDQPSTDNFLWSVYLGRPYLEGRVFAARD